MHRNTLVVVSILAVLAALIVGVNVGRQMTPTVTNPTPTPPPKPTPTPVAVSVPYTDNACGFSVNYMSNFSILENASGSAMLRESKDNGQTIVMTCQPDIPRPALPADKIETVSLKTVTGASVSAKLYHDQSAKDGTPIDALIFKHPTRPRIDVFIAGYGQAFNDLVKTVIVTP